MEGCVGVAGSAGLEVSRGGEQRRSWSFRRWERKGVRRSRSFAAFRGWDLWCYWPQG